MSDRQAFIRAICDNPADDAPRLVFADWLEERGDPRGEFIRLQCRFAAKPTPPCPKCGLVSGHRLYTHHCRGPECSARRKEWRLWQKNASTWQGEFYDVITRPMVEAIQNGTPVPPRRPLLEPASRCAFSRGFVEKVWVRGDEWLKLADDLMAANPIREVTLTTPVPYFFWDSDRGWEDLSQDSPPYVFNSGGCTERCQQRWPGIKFNLMPRHTIESLLGYQSLTRLIGATTRP